MTQFERLYKETIIKQLMEKFNYKNIMEVPCIEKITLNMGVGEAAADKKLITHAVNELTLISGQQAIITYSRKSIAGFKIRDGWPIGCKVTLRGARKYHFLERLIYVALPRIRDFRGYSAKAFDGRGNYNLGIREQIVFPEIEYDKIDKLRGLDIAITTTARNDKECYALLAAFNFPFKDKEQSGDEVNG